MNVFMAQKPELQSPPVIVESASDSWVSEFDNLHKSVTTEAPSTSQQLGANLTAKPTELNAEAATISRTKPPETLYIFDDPLHGRTTTTIAPFRSGEHNVARGRREQASADRTSRNQPIQSNRISLGRERIIDYVNRRIVPCSAGWVHHADPAQYGIDIETFSIPEPGSYEKPRTTNELMLIADRHAYRDDSAPEPGHDDSGYGGGRHYKFRHQPDHQDFQRNLLRCHKDLLCEKSAFFRDLVSQIGKVRLLLCFNSIQLTVKDSSRLLSSTKTPKKSSSK